MDINTTWNEDELEAIETLNDIFNLYKAFILDKYNKTVDDIDAVKRFYSNN